MNIWINCARQAAWKSGDQLREIIKLYRAGQVDSDFLVEEIGHRRHMWQNYMELMK